MKIFEYFVENRGFYCIFDHGLSNHYSMTIYAMKKLGASGERVEEFRNYYIQKLDPIRNDKASREINELNWKEHLGNYNNYLAYLEFFKKKYEEQGKTDLLKMYPKN